MFGSNMAARAAKKACECAEWRLPEAQRKLPPAAQRKQVELKVQQELVQFSRDIAEDYEFRIEDVRREKERLRENLEFCQEALAFYAEPANWTTAGLKAAALAAYDIKDEDGKVEEKAEPHTVAARMLERLS